MIHFARICNKDSVCNDVVFNCSNIVLEFCENVMKIENAKTNIKIEKAYRLGRKKDGATRPRPIVVKFGSYVEREMVRNLSKRLKGTNFGISPHYPPEVLEKRKKLIPVMLMCLIPKK